jgi:WD repeat-containing protein 32
VKLGNALEKAWCSNCESSFLTFENFPFPLLPRQHGYFKEISFSPDGRVIASPYANGHRILMFDAQCRSPPASPRTFPFLDDPSAIPRDRFGGAVQMVEATTSFGHSAPVLCTRFSPISASLVTGCVDGELVWHYPVI